MVKPARATPEKRGIPPRVDRKGKLVTMSAIHDGIAPESLAADFLCAAGSTDAASFARLKGHLQRHDIMPDFAGTNGITPLMAACSTGNATGAEELAAHPLVNLARADRDGWTALHYAAHCGGPECVRALLAHHAPFDAKTKTGETAFDLASDDKTRAAFLENRDFARHLQRARPDHPALNPPPPPAPSAPVKAPEADPLKDAFLRAITGVGLQWEKMPGKNVRKALVDKMASMNEDEIGQAWQAVRASQAAFPWEAVFIVAAHRGNTAVMCRLHDEILFDERTLNQALSAAVAGGDRRDAAHHLMAWGANPSAPYEVGGQLKAPSIFDGAFSRRRFGVFEELVLWRGELLKDGDIKKYRNARGLSAAERTEADFALALRLRAKEFRKLRGKTLEKAFENAVRTGDLAGVMAGYMEAQRDRFLRGNADIGAQAGGGAIALALLGERYEFARLLVADDHKITEAYPGLWHGLHARGSEKALQFAKDVREGKMQGSSVRDVGRKKRSELHILTYSGYRPHYGMF